MSEGIIIREGLAAMDFATVREWLAGTYWTPGVEREVVERAAWNSALVIGAFAGDGAQVGFMRVVSDKTRFAYLCDVIVDDAWRGRGVARAMVQHTLDHPELATVRTWTLATRDAHGVYEPLGFKPMAHPESRPETWMVLRRGQPWAEPGNR
jgi:GNAT superfamily N-acetyltransferase